MAARRQRSVFWVVSTHVVSTLFMTFAVVFGAIMFAAKFSPAFFWTGPGRVITLVAPMLSLMGMTIYSLSYIRRVASVERQMACFMPSLLTFGALIFTPVAFLLLQDFRHNNEIRLKPAAIWLVYCAAMCIAFGWLTRRGLRRMEAVEPPLRGFSVILTDSTAV